MAEDRKVAWITGGGTGIGLGGAQALAAAGWTVIISGRRKEVIDAAAAGIGRGTEAMPLDVTNAAQAGEVAADIVGRHGRIDLLVNSAGINIRDRNWADLTTQGWDSVVAANLDGVLYCMRSVLPAMRDQRSGLIVNVASWAGKLPSKVSGPAYVATKTAVVALTHAFNQEEFRNGLRACALCPGEVATDIMKNRPTPPSVDDLARMMQIEDLGRTIAFVASMPAHVCINEIVMSPTWNRSYL